MLDPVVEYGCTELIIMHEYMKVDDSITTLEFNINFIEKKKTSLQKRLANFFHWRKKQPIHPKVEQGTLRQVEWLLPVCVYLELRTDSLDGVKMNPEPDNTLFQHWERDSYPVILKNTLVHFA